MEIPDTGWDEALPLFYIFLIIFFIIIIFGLQKRIFFKMGLSNIGRRKTHTVIVITGLLIGTAMISGSLVTRDSMDYWIKEDVYRATHYVDETITVPGNFFFDQSIYELFSSDPKIDEITDGIAPMIVFEGVSVYNARTQKTNPQTTLLGFDPELDKDFGKFEISSVDKYGADLGKDEAIINSMLADEIDAKVGDEIEVYYTIPDKNFYNLTFEKIAAGFMNGNDGSSAFRSNGIGQNNSYNNISFQNNILTIKFSIKAISKNEGKAYNYGTPNVFILLESARKMYNAKANEINLIKVSNNGKIIDSVQNTDKVTKELNRIIREEQDKQLAKEFEKGFDPTNISWETKIILGINVNRVKELFLDIAETSSEGFGNFLLMMAMFTVATGVLLIINIFVMLAEERKTELGISRALGLNRGHLTKMFLFEGIGYVIPAAIIGTLAGLGIAKGLIYGINIAFTEFEGSEMPFYFYNSSLVFAFSLGAIISIVTIILISWSLSKLNIVRSIRDIPEPILKRAGRSSIVRGTSLVILGILLTLMGLNVGYATLQVLGPTIIILGGAMISRRFARQEIAFSIAGVIIFLYSLWALFYMESTGDEGMIMLVVLGLTLCFSAVMILVFNSRAIVRGVGRLLSFSPSSKAVSEPAVGYSLEKRFRTGMTIAMFSLILFIVTLMSIFTSSFVMADIENQSGGYDVIGTSSLEVGDLDNMSVLENGILKSLDTSNLSNDFEYFDSIRSYYYWGKLFTNSDEVPSYGPPQHGIFGIDQDFVSHQNWKLERVHPDFENESEVWFALLTNDSYCIIDVNTASTHVPIKLNDWISFPESEADKSVRFKVIGIVQETLLPGVFINKNAMSKSFSQVQGNNMFLFKIKPGVDVENAADRLNTDFRKIGMDAISIEKLIKQINQAISDMMRMFNLFLALGLLIGVVSLSVLAYRAVMERKRAIGMLRAIGFTKSQILSSFLIEILFITTLGIGLGLLVGFTAGYGIWYTTMKDLNVPFTFPWMTLGQIIFAVYLAAIIFTIIPAYKASKIQPAEAIRHIG